jgi:hypothetical protein
MSVLRKVPQVMFLGGTTRKQCTNPSWKKIIAEHKSFVEKNRLCQMNKEGLRCRQKTQGGSQPI